MPVEDPQANPSQQSAAGVTYSRVLQGIHTLYPPADLQMRNAASRTDGYWTFVQKGEQPPKSLNYGEFDFYFFASLLDRALTHHGSADSWSGKVFCDIGSGTARLVVSAAALHPQWKLCRGVEILKGLHAEAEQVVSRCRECAGGGDGAAGTGELALPGSEPGANMEMAPVELSCGSFDDSAVFFGDADCVFVFSSCMPEGMRSNLGRAIARQCKSGTIVMTTEYPLSGGAEGGGSGRFELLESIDGYCWVTGGSSTSHVHRLV